MTPCIKKSKSTISIFSPSVEFTSFLKRKGVLLQELMLVYNPEHTFSS